jgi:ribonuclease HIII
MAEKPGAIRHAEAPASAAEEHMAAVAAASIGNRSFFMFLVVRKT